MRAQRAAPSARVFALTTGTLGLLAVAVLILTITPRHQDAPIAISATTTPATTPATIAPATRAGGDAALTEAAGSRPAFAVRGSVTAEAVSLQHALATPIGDGRLALATVDALIVDEGDRIEVRLPSGRVGSARAITRAGDTWLIELHQAETGHEIATTRPAGSEVVTVMESPPVKIALADIGTLDIAEGTAVLDSDGDLVGLCSRRRGDGEVRLIEVSAELVGATSAGR